MLVLLLCLLVVLSHLPDAQRFEKHYHLQVNFETAAYEIPIYAKLWYHTISNIINTGTFTFKIQRSVDPDKRSSSQL